MSIPGNANPLLVASAGAAGPYEIQRSLRFNSGDSAHLSKVFSSAGNRQSWTWAGWVKRSSLTGTTVRQVLFSGRTADSDTGFLEFGFNATTPAGTADTFYCASATIYSESAAVFRDVSAWYHIVVSYNGANIKAYVNNVEILSWARTGDLGINSSAKHTIGANAKVTRYFNGYLADIHFIDGQALDPTSFGEFDDNGVWQPKAYTGTYGTNGFRLDFSDNSAATAGALGADSSGNGNNWTPNNLSVTAGADNDSLVDTPTDYGTDTGAGGEVRGNYATFDPLNKLAGTPNITNGNLKITATASNDRAATTIALNAVDKVYYEVRVDTTLNSLSAAVRVYTEATNFLFTWRANGSTINLTGNPTLASYTSGSILGVAIDNSSDTVTLYKNGVSQGSYTYTPFDGPYFIGVFFAASGNSCTLNTGQRPFAYTAPSGYKALCTTNLPEPTIADGSTAMDVKLYTGNGSTQTISGLGFSPDLVWIKDRTNTYSHRLFDTVRGATKGISTNLTDAELTLTSDLTQFNSDGFNVGSGLGVNVSSAAHVAWTWDAGSSTVTNTDGTITSSVRANASAGFSIVTWTGTGANGSYGHGLGVPPILYITKNRTSTADWIFKTTAIDGSLDFLYLNLTNAKGDSSVAAPTSTVINTGTGIAAENANGANYVTYAFAPVAGYSAFGSYTGNGSADGPFVYTGFRPRWLLFKRSSLSGSNWGLYDAARDPYNSAQELLRPNLSNAESSVSDSFDFLCNGFKARTSSSGINDSSETFVYAAFAENPFKYARAR